MKYELWAMRNCFACSFTKDVLEERNFTFKELFLYEDFELEQLEQLTGSNQLPAIFADGKYLGGVDWVEKLLKENK
jgi:glutaredoxin